MSPLVSVIVPAYNASDYIDRAIASVLGQTEQDLEIIVVDDASTDDTYARVAAIDDPRIRLLQNETNRGPSGSRNRAVDAAVGTWIALLDADDWYLPSRLTQLLQAAAEHEADIVADDIYFVGTGTTVNYEHGVFRDARGYPRPLDRLFRTTQLPLRLDAETFVNGCLPGGNDPRIGLIKPLFKRAFLTQNDLQYDPNALYGQDYIFYLDCLGAGARFVLIDTPGYCYRIHPQMRSHHYGAETQRNRLRTNQTLLERPYVQANPRLHALLEERHRQLQADCVFHQLERKLSSFSLDAIVQVTQTNPSGLWVYASRTVRRRAGRLYSRLRRLPTRLRQFLGLTPHWDALSGSSSSP